MTLSRNARIVQDFCDAWVTLDTAKLGAFLTDDLVYHNMPLQPIGRDAALGMWGGLFKVTEAIEFEMLNLMDRGDVVMTERVDRFRLKNGVRLDLPVMGTFELRDGLIAVWRDYYDGPASAPLGEAAGRPLRPA